MKKSKLLSSKFRVLFKPGLRYVFHVLFWLFFYLDMLFDLFFSGFADAYMLLTYLLQLLLDMILVYGNNYLFMPGLLLQNKNKAYLLTMFALLLGLVLVNVYLQQYLLFDYFYGVSYWEPEEGLSDRISAYLNIFSFQASILGAGAGIKLFKMFLQDRFRLQNMEISQLESELSHLKAQLNPHFLFNALNNIYVLTKIDAEKAQRAIELLSGLLRYQLYESTLERVPLQNELDYLEAFLQMEKIRKKDMRLEFEVEGDTDNKYIAPLMLITFIENAVKHGISSAGTGWIHIHIRIDQDKFLFKVENSLNVEKTQRDKGIGLDNLRRRLSLIYPESHQIEIRKEGQSYFASLSLTLDNGNRQNPA